MDFIADKHALLNGLRAARAASTSGSSLLLQNVLIEATSPTTVEIIATDLRVGMSGLVNVVALEKGNGKAIASAKQLVAAVRAMPEGEITVKTSEAAIHLYRGRSHISIPRVGDNEASDFPVNKPKLDNSSGFTLSREELARLISTTRHAVSSDLTRPHLAGINFDVKDGVFCAVSTDGHRLSLAQASEGCEGFTALLPTPSAVELLELLKSSDKVECVHAQLANEGRSVLFTIGDFCLWSQLTEDSFPRYQQIIPSTHKVVLKINPAKASEAIRRATSVLTTRPMHVGLAFDPEVDVSVMNVTAQDASGARARDTFEVETDFRESSTLVHANAVYILDSLNACGPGDAELRINGTLDPLVIASGDDLHVVMPVRAGE